MFNLTIQNTMNRRSDRFALTININYLVDFTLDGLDSPALEAFAGTRRQMNKHSMVYRLLWLAVH